MQEILPEVKSFTARKMISGLTNKEMLKIEFRTGEDPLKSPVIGAFVFTPQVLRGFITLLFKFVKENKDFFEDTNFVKDLGHISKPEDFPIK